MAGYLLDTNHLSAAIRRVSPLRERIRGEIRQAVRFGTCMPVICELEAAIQQTKRPASCRATLDRLLQEVRVWPVDRAIARVFGEIYIDLRNRGRALSHVDITCAAIARSMDLTILTTDRDFDALPDIRTENWISST
jgi:tRNA(fMet)-specific endonuclease VapC